MVSPTDFITSYPEFADAPSALIMQVLADAYAMTPASIWPGSILDQGAQLRAAQSLALSPFGRQMAMVNDEGKTGYDVRLNRLVHIVAAGGAVI